MFSQNKYMCRRQYRCPKGVEMNEKCSLLRCCRRRCSQLVTQGKSGPRRTQDPCGGDADSNLLAAAESQETENTKEVRRIRDDDVTHSSTQLQ
jgi:hypothetical protein